MSNAVRAYDTVSQHIQRDAARGREHSINSAADETVLQDASVADAGGDKDDDCLSDWHGCL